MVKKLKEIIEEHNKLYKRLQKADQLYEVDPEQFHKRIDLYTDVLKAFEKNFNEFYFYFSKSSVDKEINSMNELTINDFKFTKLNEDRIGEN